MPAYDFYTSRTLDPTVDTAVYAAGDLLCEKLTLEGVAALGGGHGVIESITVVDLAQQMSALKFVFFDSDPSGTTFTENAAFDPVDADLDKCIGIAYMGVSNYDDFNDNSFGIAVGSDCNLPIPFKAANDDLYLAVVIGDSSTPDYVAAGDIRIRVNIRRWH